MARAAHFHPRLQQQLARLNDVPKAAAAAKDYVAGAIAHADELEVGAGYGPTHHFWQLWC